MRILITSGGTKIPIDKVRHIGNMSSGTFGAKIGLQALKERHGVYFLHAKGSKTPMTHNFDMDGGDDIEKFAKWYLERKPYLSSYVASSYDDYDDYVTALNEIIGFWNPDVVVLAAAVSDFGVENYVDGKIRTKGDLSINLKPLPKVISSIKQKYPKVKLVGFKLLVNSTDEELIQAAEDSLKNNGCDMVVANDLRDIKNNDHRLIIVQPGMLPAIYKTTEYNRTALEEAVVSKLKFL